MMQNKWADHYSKKAKKDKYPARSVYKLQEIQKKYNIIKKGDTVLDLGCAPGSWLIYAAKIVGDKGCVVGIDKKTVSGNIPPNVRVFTGDIFDFDDKFEESVGKNIAVVLSDMAPDTTGSKFVDAARSFELCRAALYIAEQILTPGGSFVCKIFQGENFNEFSETVKQRFKKTKIFKPESSRKASKEIYIIGFEKKQEDVCQVIINGLQ